MFGVRSLLGVQKFASETEVKSAACQWRGLPPASFFGEGIQKRVYR